MTGKANYAAMLKESVSPGLRKLGFKGSGGRYVWPSRTHWAQLGFQKSAWGSEADVSFTFNVSVVSKAAWEDMRHQWHPPHAERPAPTVGYESVRGGDDFYWERIGGLTPENRDLWWDVDARTDTAALGDEIVGFVAMYALPTILVRI